MRFIPEEAAAAPVAAVHPIEDDCPTPEALDATAACAQQPLADSDAQPALAPQPAAVLRLRGGKGGFGSNLRAAGKLKLTDNFDACRDLQGRRIRHKTAAQKLATWQAEAAERELEKVALRHMKEAAKAEKRGQEEEVDVEGLRAETRAALNGVQDAVQCAVRGGLVNNGAKEGQQGQGPEQKRRRVDPLLLGMDEDSEEDDSSEEEEETAGGAIHSEMPQQQQRQQPPDEEDAYGTAAAAAVPTEPVTEPQNGGKMKSASGPPAAEADDHASPAAPASASQPAAQEAAAPSPAGPVDLANFDSAEALQGLGLDRLKAELTARGLKCGGTLAQRADRLFLLKHTPLADMDAKHLAAGKRAA